MVRKIADNRPTVGLEDTSSQLKVSILGHLSLGKDGSINKRWAKPVVQVRNARPCKS